MKLFTTRCHILDRDQEGGAPSTDQDGWDMVVDSRPASAPGFYQPAIEGKEVELASAVNETSFGTTVRKRCIPELALDQSALTSSAACLPTFLCNDQRLVNNTLPQLFVVLCGSCPENDCRLHFLCECIDSDGLHDHDLHYLSDHEGYPVFRLKEFIDDYGPRTLDIMSAIRDQIHLTDPVFTARFQRGLDFITLGIMQRASGSHISHSRRPSASLLTYLTGYPNNNHYNTNGENSQGYSGNLYLHITPKSAIRWVCADHYHMSYDEQAAKYFNSIIEVNSGTLNRSTGTLAITLNTPILLKEFTEALCKVRHIYELEIRIPSNTSITDLHLFRVALEGSSVTIIHIAFIPLLGIKEDHRFAEAKANSVCATTCSRNFEKVTLSNIPMLGTIFPETTPDRLQVLVLNNHPIFEDQPNTKEDNHEEQGKRLATLLEKCVYLRELHLESSDGSMVFYWQLYHRLESVVERLPLSVLRMARDRDYSVAWNFVRKRGKCGILLDVVCPNLSDPHIIFTGFKYQIRNLKITTDVEFKELKNVIGRAYTLRALELTCPAEKILEQLDRIEKVFDELRNSAKYTSAPCSLRLTDSSIYDQSPVRKNFLFTPNVKESSRAKGYKAQQHSAQQQQQVIAIHLPTTLKLPMGFISLRLLGLGRFLRSFTVPPNISKKDAAFLKDEIQKGSGLEVFSLAISSVAEDESWTHITQITEKFHQNASELRVALDLEYDARRTERINFLQSQLSSITSLWCTSRNLERWFQDLDGDKSLDRLKEFLLIFQPSPAVPKDRQLLSRTDIQYMTRFLSRCTTLSQLHIVSFSLDPLAWDMVLDAINFSTLTELNFAGSNFGAGHIYSFLQRLRGCTVPPTPESMMILDTTNEQQPFASAPNKAAIHLNKGKGIQLDEEMTLLTTTNTIATSTSTVAATTRLEESKKLTASLTSIIFSRSGMSETAQLELHHAIHNLPGFRDCSVQFQ
ncbi:hypothetical protein BG004_005207 [Podila humilis]|nr:hypothetical protein BG004_005207 [Podila humilis]